jgi:hypothetical protein
MKLTLCIVTTALLLGGSTIFAQVPGMMTMQQASVPQGTDLGANTTVNAAGIALGNRVKLRGFVDFRYDNTDVEYVDHDKRFRTGVDLDLLIDFSPVTSEIHLNAASGSGVSLEQAFIRYSFNRDFNLSMGRQLTVMGMESDESTGLHQVSHGYAADVAIVDGCFGSYCKSSNLYLSTRCHHEKCFECRHDSTYPNFRTTAPTISQELCGWCACKLQQFPFWTYDWFA